MSMDYIRQTYGVPAKRGGRVRVRFDSPDELNGREGTITSATSYVKVRLDGEKRPDIFYPLELEYLEGAEK